MATEWAVAVVFEDGGKCYVGRGEAAGTVKYTRYRGSSLRFETEEAAAQFAERWARDRRVVDVLIERIDGARTTGTW